MFIIQPVNKENATVAMFVQNFNFGLSCSENVTRSKGVTLNE